MITLLLYFRLANQNADQLVIWPAACRFPADLMFSIYNVREEIENEDKYERNPYSSRS